MMRYKLVFIVLLQLFNVYSGQRVAPGVPPQQYQQQYAPSNQVPQHMQQQQMHQQQIHQQQQQQQMLHQQQQQQQMHQPQQMNQVPIQQQQMHQVPVQQQQMHQVPVQQQQQQPPQGHGHGHGHHVNHGQILNAANIAGEKDHIAEHMEVPMDTSKMSEQELQFHYFKMHDADNNNKLDGCELIKSLIHWHEQGGKERATTQGPPGNDEKIFKDDELIALIDPILGMDDGNNDGYIDYPEFVRAQQKAAAAPPKTS